MKIQCACGARFSFDITPEMTSTAVQFVCPTCGLNSTSLVNHLIHQHVAGALPAPGGRTTMVLPGPVEAAPAPAASSPPPAVPSLRITPPASPAPPLVPVPVAVAAPLAKPVVRVAIPATAAAPAAPSEHPGAQAAEPCPKHFGQFVTNRCVVCQKPICPQCMALFGWVCSPLCRNKAESQGIAVPEFEGQKSVVERKQWRRTARTAGAIAVAVVIVLGGWFWYAWFGSVPKTSFSAKLPEASSVGELRAGPRDQILLLHGGTLSRHDVKARRVVWSVPLIDERQIAEQAAVALKAMERGREAAVADGADRDDFRIPSVAEITRDMANSAMAAMSLHVSGENIWIESDGKLVRHDWDTGKAGREIALDENSPGVSRRGNELLLMAHHGTGSEMTRIDLATGETRQEIIARPAPAIAARTNAGPALAARGTPAATPRSATQAIVRPGAPSNSLARAGVSSNLIARSGLRPGARQLDPARVARDVQNLPLPNRLALPATLAAAANQERLRAEMNDFDPAALEGLMPGVLASDGDDLRVIPTASGYVQFSSHLVERRTATRKVIKNAPTKSALDGPVNQAATMAIANEILNEIARDRGGDTVQEDESRYQVTLRRPGAPDWTSDVIGRPGFVSLDTVDLVTGGKSVVVLDKENKQLWEAKLTYEVRDGGDFAGDHPFGAGPAVERGDTLFLFDAGVLSAFELRTGTARWRLPSVGIAGLFFDDKGMIYVNTTTASPDSVRYSRQIDVSQKTHNMVLKVDSRTGKTLWRADNEGMVNYVSGKFIYTVESAAGDDGGFMGMKIGLETRAHIRIRRLKPSSGRVLWEHHQERAPLDYQFEQNEIRILFRNELQVLRFLAL